MNKQETEIQLTEERVREIVREEISKALKAQSIANAILRKRRVTY